MAAVVTPWYESKTVQGALWIFLSAVLGALAPMLASKSVDWWSLGFVTVTALIVSLKRMFDPDIQGPAAIMNKDNFVKGGG